MLKNVFIGIGLLITGFILGGVATGLLWSHRPGLNPAVEPPAGPVEIAKARDFTGIVETVFPSVVNISTVKRHLASPAMNDDPFYDFFSDFFGKPSQGYSDEVEPWNERNVGSGVIVSEEGYIITNNHVVADAEEIRVTLYDKRSFVGTVVGSDPKTDLAVLKIKGGGELPVVPWGNSDQLEVGEFVLAIGNSFGLNHTVTMGIISATGRANVGIAEYEDFIQTDAAINPGNSGGPLIDTRGGLVGINTAIFSKNGGYQGIGFAVPSNMVRRLMKQLIDNGRVIRGWLGVTIQALTNDLAAKFGLEVPKGALISEITAGSPADRAGLEPGDVIVRFGGKEVESPSVLKNLVAHSQPGVKIPVFIVRDSNSMELAVTMGELSMELGDAGRKRQKRQEKRQSAFTGISVMELTRDIARQLGVDSPEDGVVVVRVEPDSPANEAGLKRGDVIHEVDRRAVTSVDEFYRLISEAGSDQSVLLYLSREGRKFYMTIFIS